MRRPAHRDAAGFTLTELLCALAIAALLTAAGAPAFGGLLSRARATQVESAITGALQHARSAAVMHNARIVVCTSTDQRTCNDSTDWRGGWLVALDTDHDDQPDTSAAILRSAEPLPAGTMLTTTAGRERVVFHPDGTAMGSNARFTICRNRARGARSVVISNSGRVRVEDAPPASAAACLARLAAVL